MPDSRSLPDQSATITYKIEHTSLPTAGFDWSVCIEAPGHEPLTESGLSTWSGARRRIRRRVRKTLGWGQYMRVRRSMP